MADLKYELRRMFEERSMNGACRDDRALEEGILEKIINLTFVNLRTFEPCDWKIISVKSPQAVQRMYRLAGRAEEILDAAVILMVLAKHSGEGYSRDFSHCRDLLVMSIVYASKYYGIGCRKIDTMDFDAVKYDFNISNEFDIASILCLSHSNRLDIPPHLKNRRIYREVVKEI